MILDGVAYYVNWENFLPGSSFFIPSINPVKTKKELRKVFKEKNFEVAMKISIEENIKGVRVWRV